MPDEGGAGPVAVPSPAPGRTAGRRTATIFASVWLIYLAYPLAELLQGPAGAARRIAGVAGLLAFAALYVSHWWSASRWWFAETGQDQRRSALALAGLAALAAALTALLGGNGLPLLIFLAAGCSTLEPPRRAAIAVGAVALALGAALLWAHQSPETIAALTVTCAAAGGAALATRRMAATASSLRAAQAELSRLAVVDERLRIARDVHDLLGHSLSVIALKADLAGRLLPADPARAAAEVADVQAVARRSLSDVRQAVAGYRRLRLDEELAHAREILAGAGCRCAFTQGASDLTEEAGSVLAWVVREATTNILRHSGARNCQIQVARRKDRAEVRIEDDGRGALRADGGGSGIKGLAERLRAAGGGLTAGPRGEGGFAVAAWVPLRPPAADACPPDPAWAGAGPPPEPSADADATP